MRQAGQFAPAFDLLQAAWNDAPGNEEILSALARLYQSGGLNAQAAQTFRRSEEHTSELQSLMRISYAVFCLKKKNEEKPLQHVTTLQKRQIISDNNNTRIKKAQR